MIDIIQSEERKLISDGWVTNIVTSFGYPDKTLYISPSDDTIYDRLWDLASVTKLYTLITILSLYENDALDFEKPIKYYSTQFPGISELNIFELLNFSVELTTSSRIDLCGSFDEAIDLLHNIQIKSRNVIYSDMPAMVITQLLNEIYHSDQFFRNYTYDILNKSNVQNTFFWKDIKASEKNIENYDFEYKYTENGGLKVIRTPLSTCHDPKARIIPYTGHAGLFASSKSVASFANALLSEKIVSYKTLSILLNKKYQSWDKTHHHGLLSNMKHPDKKYSEIPVSCSDFSISMSGYSGSYLLLDFDNHFFASINANRLSNRITNLAHENRSFAYPCTKDYVFKKDELVNLICESMIHK